MIKIKIIWRTFLICAASFAAMPALAQNASAITIPPMHSANFVLILAPQGADPATDEIKFNQWVRGVTQLFSAGLKPLLEQHQLTVFNVIDQELTYSASQKLAIYSARNRTKSAVVLTLENTTIDDDQSVLLVAQHIMVELLFKDNQVTGIRMGSVVKKSYVLHSSKDGDSRKSMASMAQDFVEFLEKENRF